MIPNLCRKFLAAGLIVLLLGVISPTFGAVEDDPVRAKKKVQTEEGKHFGDEGFVGEVISTDLSGVGIADFLKFISDQYGVSFVYEPAVLERKVNMKIVSQPWNKAVEAVLRVNGLTYRRNGDIFEIGAISDEIKRLEELRKRQQIQRLTEQAVTRQYVINWIRLNDSKTAGKLEDRKSQVTVFPTGVALTENQPATIPNVTPSLDGTPGEGLLGIIGNLRSPIGTVTPDFRTNSLIVTDAPEYLDKIEAVIKLLDVPVPYVEIEARIIVVDQNFSRDIGALLSAGVVNNRTGAAGVGGTAPVPQSPGNFSGSRISPYLLTPVPNGSLAGVANTVFGFTTGRIGTAVISGSLQLQEQRGVVKTISTPRLTLESGETGRINSGVQIPYISGGGVQGGVGVVQTVVFQEARLGLEATALVNGRGNVTLSLTVTNDSADLTTSVPNGQVPITKMFAGSKVIIPDGGTTILGGILVNRESQRESRTPFLADIPIIGNAFKRNERSRGKNELLIFVTARIRTPEQILAGENFQPNLNETIDREKEKSKEEFKPIPLPTPLAEPFRNPGEEPKGKKEKKSGESVEPKKKAGDQ